MAAPRIVISGLCGGSGKTILTIGLIKAWRRRGRTIIPFKKGPDYIDAGWLSAAADRPCHNLDTFLASPAVVTRFFLRNTPPDASAVIEGNRGLYDGIDLSGNTSTAEIAKLLQAPVILSIDCTKTTRTAAAVISGCIAFDPEVRIAGVILNRVAGARHESILTRSIQTYCNIPVVGVIPKLSGEHFPERHMGLVPTPEHAGVRAAVEIAADIAETHLDLSALAAIAESAPSLKPPEDGPASPEAGASHCFSPDTIQVSKRSAAESPEAQAPRIGVIRDPAFQFYYPENIEALKEAGGNVVFINALNATDLPEVHALYIGGGFPETHAEELADNRPFRASLRRAAEGGLPVYAECGGLMYMGRSLQIEGREYPMTGVLPIDFGLSRRPAGLGYTISRVDTENPFFPVGACLRGHEFHYSRAIRIEGDIHTVLSMERGTGVHRNRDGIVKNRVFAVYTHLHAVGEPRWAPAVVRAAETYRRGAR